MCFELPLRSSLEGVSQERMSHCSLIAGCQEVSVRPIFLLALTGETYWLVLCSGILSRRAHVPLNSIGMLQICYERFSAARTPTPSRAHARVHQLHAASIVCLVSCACAECVQGIDVSECALTALVRYCAGVCDRQHHLYFVQFTGTAWRLR